MFKRLFCIQLICMIMLLTTISFYYCEPIVVYADDAGLGDYLDFLNQFETFWKAVANDDMPWPMVRDAFYGCLTHDMGLVTSTVWINQADLLRKGLIKVHEKRYGVDNVKSDDQKIKEIAQDFKQNISVNNNFTSRTYNNNSRQILIDLSNFIMSQSGEFYAYSLQLEKNVTNLPANSYYSKTRDFIKSKQDTYRCNLLFNRLFSNMANTAYDISDNGNGYVNMIVCIPKSINLVYRADHRTYFDLDLYDNNWNQIWKQNMISKGCKVYLFNKNTEEFEENTQLVQYFDVYFTGGCLVYSDSGTMSSSYGFGSGITVTSGGVHTYKVYRTLDDLKSATAGVSNYYFTNNWTNFINNSGDTYTIDNSNVNKVTYGDVITYIDNHYEDKGDYPTIEDIKKWIDERNTEPEPTPTPTPTPGPDDPILDPDDPTPTPTPTPGPDDYDPWRHTVSGNGTGGDTDDWSFWDFLKGIINFLKGIVEGIGSILSAITDWFTVDTDLIKTHVSGVIDGSVPLPNGVSYNGIVNEIIPVEDIKSIGKTFTDIPDGFVPGTYYPKLTIKTPQIIRQFYDEEEIVLLDFEEWASTFVIVRTLLEFSFWLAEIYYLLSKLRPVISIS